MAIIDIISLMMGQNVLFTIGLSATFMPISIAQGALLLAQSNPPEAINGIAMSFEEFDLANRFYLVRSAEILKELSKYLTHVILVTFIVLKGSLRYWASLTQIEIASETVPLSRTQPTTVCKEVALPPKPLASIRKITEITHCFCGKDFIFYSV